MSGGGRKRKRRRCRVGGAWKKGVRDHSRTPGSINLPDDFARDTTPRGGERAGGRVVGGCVGPGCSGDGLGSVANMLDLAGWEGQAQEPELDEFTIVLEGYIDVEHADGVIHVRAGQAVITRGGERIRYTTHEGARYIAVCLPAFHVDRVHRDDDDEYDRDPVE